MHRCWEVAELVQLIFEALDPYAVGVYRAEGIGQLKASTLFRLAQTCRQLCEPALDVLWRTNEGLILLLKCLPTNTWAIRDGYFEIVSPIQSKDWERFLLYSRRVTTFSACDRDIVVGSSALESMISLPPGTLLPNVQGLSCKSSSVLFPYLTLLVGPRVTQLATFLDGPAFRISALQSIARYFKSLEYVHLNTPVTHREMVRPYVPGFFMQIVPPRRLEIQGLNQAAYRHLAMLPTIRSLELLDLVELPFPSPCSFSDITFPVLDELKIQAASPLFATNFLSVFDKAPFTLLSIAASKNSTVSNSLSLLFAVCAACIPATLVKLHIYLCEDNETVLSNCQAYAMTFDMIRPLTVYSNLRRVSLVCPLGFELDNKSVETLGQAWPQLECLCIVGDFSAVLVPSSYPTLAAVLSLARHCPLLQDLCLAVDARVVPEAADSATSYSTALINWEPVESPMDCPDSVAEVLGKVFPELSIEYKSETWAKVDTLLTNYRETKTSRVSRGSDW
ncbi:hypothetical protein R3P38DRAFT_2720428 [Favolaschia claudopus]|uniref:F-box domain-containing protein n=1 Tax=Favolaschia claudopus TaxID=2862362 RepID=A0AAW0ANL1_9AGAR